MSPKSVLLLPLVVVSLVACTDAAEDAGKASPESVVIDSARADCGPTDGPAILISLAAPAGEPLNVVVAGPDGHIVGTGALAAGDASVRVVMDDLFVRRPTSVTAEAMTRDRDVVGMLRTAVTGSAVCG